MIVHFAKIIVQGHKEHLGLQVAVGQMGIARQHTILVIVVKEIIQVILHFKPKARVHPETRKYRWHQQRRTVAEHFIELVPLISVHKLFFLIIYSQIIGPAGKKEDISAAQVAYLKAQRYT